MTYTVEPKLQGQCQDMGCCQGKPSAKQVRSMHECNADFNGINSPALFVQVVASAARPLRTTAVLPDATTNLGLRVEECMLSHSLSGIL